MRIHLTALILAAAGCAGAAPGSHADLLIQNVVIVSPERANPSPATDVLLRDGIIAAIGPDAANDASPTARSVEGGGLYLIPGLIDGHTHLSEIPGMTFEQEQDFPDIAQQAHRQIPRSYLYHGFTTVIDLNGRPDYIEAWNAQQIRPNAYFCGAAPVFDGYPMSWMPKPARYELMPYFLYDESRADEFPENVDPADHSPDAVISKMRADGAICVKTHHERGFGGRGDLPVPTVGLIRNLVSSAHRSGMPVLMHANSQSAQAFGVEAGVDAFAHGMWTWNDRAATELSSEIAVILAAAIEQEIAVQPTIQVLYGERDLHDPDYLSKPALRHVLPASLIDWHRTEEGQWWRKRMAGIPYIATLLESSGWQSLDAEPIARVTAALSYAAEKQRRAAFWQRYAERSYLRQSARPQWQARNGQLDHCRRLGGDNFPRRYYRQCALIWTRR